MCLRLNEECSQVRVEPVVIIYWGATGLPRPLLDPQYSVSGIRELGRRPTSLFLPSLFLYSSYHSLSTLGFFSNNYRWTN